MDTQEQPSTQPLMPEAPNPQPAPVAQPSPQVPLQIPQNVPPWVIIAGVILVILVGSLLFAQNRKPTVILPPTPTPTMTPTPTPIRQQSSIATQSAFMELDSAVTILNTSLSSYNPQDQSLVPPVLDLSLGFSN